MAEQIVIPSVDFAGGIGFIYLVCAVSTSIINSIIWPAYNVTFTLAVNVT